MATATAMYHTRPEPAQGHQPRPGSAPRRWTSCAASSRRRLHKAFLRYHDANNWPLLREALKAMGRADLIGNGKHHLIPSFQPADRRRLPERAAQELHASGTQAGPAADAAHRPAAARAGRRRAPQDGGDGAAAQAALAADASIREPGPGAEVRRPRHSCATASPCAGLCLSVAAQHVAYACLRRDGLWPTRSAKKDSLGEAAMGTVNWGSRSSWCRRLTTCSMPVPCERRPMATICLRWAAGWLNPTRWTLPLAPPCSCAATRPMAEPPAPCASSPMPAVRC